ncbi:lipoprotein [Mycobacterium tuberculosis]|nr:lipoprotein [Mycobacterium tuberculosis]
MSEGTAAPRGRRVTVVVAVLALLAGAVLVVRAATGGPGTDGPEAGFARDMSTHHAQAVRMSFIVRDRTHDPETRLLAYDIITTQQAQIGMMTAWLDEWGLPKTDPSGAMRWMSGHGGHRGGASAMPGIATREQLAELERASGRAAEVLFLRLMIAHHRGGVDMAEAVAARTGHERVRHLAGTMVSGQRSEIAQLNAMLRERGAPTA